MDRWKEANYAYCKFWGWYVKRGITPWSHIKKCQTIRLELIEYLLTSQTVQNDIILFVLWSLIDLKSQCVSCNTVLSHCYLLSSQTHRCIYGIYGIDV